MKFFTILYYILPIYSVANKDNLNPVLLVHGLGAAQLDVKLDDDDLKSKCQFDQEWSPIFLSLENMYFQKDQCFNNLLYLDFDKESKTWNSPSGVEIRIRHDYTLAAFDSLDDTNLIMKYASVYLGDIIKMFLSEGYVEGSNIFAFPYDWRYTVETFSKDKDGYMESRFKELRQLIEKSYEINLRPIKIVTHSMGGLIINYFLTRYIQNDEWVQKYVNEFIPINCPWGGSTFTTYGIISGDNMGLPLIPQNQFMDVIHTLPSILYINPTHDLIDSQDFFIKAGDRNYTVSEIRDIIEKLGLERMLKNYDYLHEGKYTISNTKILPKIPIHVIYSNGVNTIKSMEFKNDFYKGFKEDAILTYDDGDHSINSQSQVYFKNYDHYNTSLTQISIIPNVSHFQILKDQRLIDLLKNIVITDNKVDDEFFYL